MYKKTNKKRAEKRTENITLTEGPYRINEARVSSLDATKFAGLRKPGAFILAYTVLFSMPQLRQLHRRHQFLEL